MRFESEGNPSSLACPEGLFDSVKIGLQIGQIKVIFNIGPPLGKTRYPLVYVHWFRPPQSIDHVTWMFRVVPSSRQHGPNAEVISVDHICRPVHLIPHWCGGSIGGDELDKFLLNKYIDLDLFDTLDGTVAI